MNRQLQDVRLLFFAWLVVCSECVLTNADMTLDKDEGELIIQLSPNASLIEVYKNNDISINCSVNLTFTRANLSWYRDNEQIKFCSENLTCLLEIKDATYPEDDGNYTCVVTNAQGSGKAIVYILVLENLARGKPTLQSSTLNGRKASRAVDGIKNTYFTDGSCTQTNIDRVPWWRVDLGLSHDIKMVRLTNVRNCCWIRLKNIEIIVGNVDQPNLNSVFNEHNELCTYHARRRRQIKELVCSNVVQGRYVYVVKKTMGYLRLCEVEVFGIKGDRVELIAQLSPNASLIEVNENSDTSITCSVNLNFTRANISWYKDSKQIKLCSENFTCLLEIENAKYPDDDGSYTCILNAQGPGKAVVYISVLVPVSLEKPRIKNAVYEILQSVSYKKNAVLQCYIKRANPLPRIIWRYKPYSCGYNDPDGGWTKYFTKISVTPHFHTRTRVSTLVVPPSKDIAFYSCEARNKAGRESLNITIMRTGLSHMAGRFRFLEKQMAIRKGRIYLYDIIHINCSTTIANATTSLYYWEKHPKNRKNMLINEDELRRIGQSFMVTIGKSFKKYGMFDTYPVIHALIYCKAQYESEIITAERASFLIWLGERPLPVVLTPNIQQITLEKSSNFSIQCQANDTEHLAVSLDLRWFKVIDNKTHPVDRQFVHQKGSFGKEIAILVFTNISKQDEGSYQCRRKSKKRHIKRCGFLCKMTYFVWRFNNSTLVSQDWGMSAYSIRMTAFQLNLKDGETPVVMLSPEVNQIKVPENNNSAVLNCSMALVFPRATIGWYKDGKRIKYCSESLNCLLEIKNAKYPEDNGKYACIAKNSQGSDQKILNILVLVPVSLKKTKLSEKEHTVSKLVSLRENAELRCQVESANPLPIIVWRFKPFTCSGKSCDVPGNGWTRQFWRLNVTPETIPTNVSILVVPPSETTAFYSCEASNEAGKDYFNITLLRTGRDLVNITQQRTDSKDPPGMILEANSNSIIVAVAVSCSVIAILIVISVVYIYKTRKKDDYALHLKPLSNYVVDEKLTINEQSHRLPYDMKWEFPRDNINLIEPIGHGAFGEVWLAKAKGILEFKSATANLSSFRQKRLKRIFKFTSHYHTVDTYENADETVVAVKTLKDDGDDSDYKDLASELKIFIFIGEHDNIVNLLGACTRQGKLMVIMEYCPHGDLLNFLRSKREIFEPSWIKSDRQFQKILTFFDLATVTYQIARGMDYLSSKKCIHRDLAARNILVSKDHNKDYIVKIADFGMARNVYKEGVYAKESVGVLPLKWTAPESLFDSIYSSKTDIWSFGVVLWEIFTLGGSPYPGLSTDGLLKFLKDERRMEKPDDCPDEFYDLMIKCWSQDPDDRPTFAKLFELIADIIGDFTDANVTYLRLESGEGRDEKLVVSDLTYSTAETDNISIEDDIGLKEISSLEQKNPKTDGCEDSKKLAKNEEDDSMVDEYVPNFK